jgi:hypothetical protein
LSKDKFTNCAACAYAGMEPDDPRLICGHADSGAYGKYLKGVDPLPHCKGEKFEQHPHRNRDGSLKR